MGNITLGQIRDLVFLRERGAPVEAALRGCFAKEFGRIWDRCDLADMLGRLIEEGAEMRISERVQKIISRLKSGGIVIKSDDPRLIQAKRLWNLGFAGEAEHFDTYLKEIPEIPERLLVSREGFPFLCLADPRLGIRRSCELLWIECAINDVVSCDARHATPPDPFWFRFSGTTANSLHACDNELVGTAMTGVMAYAHNPSLLNQNRSIALPGSRCAIPTVHLCAALSLGGWRPHLSLVPWDDAQPRPTSRFCL